MAHTPGPWVASTTASGTPRVAAGDRTLALMAASDKISREVTEANARLMASAPDLLNVLTTMDSAIAMGNEPRHWDTGKTQTWLKEAIDKARGGA